METSASPGNAFHEGGTLPAEPHIALSQAAVKGADQHCRLCQVFNCLPW